MNRFRQRKQIPAESEAKCPCPMREFEHTPANEAPTKAKRRFNLVLYSLLPVLVLLLVVGAGIFFILDAQGKGDVAEESVESGAFLSSGSDLSARELFEAYLKAIGGRVALSELRSVRYKGKVIISSEEKVFQMTLMFPNKGMLVTNPGEINSMKVVLNGDVAWQVIDKIDGSHEVVPLDEESAQSLKVRDTLRSIALESQFAGCSVREIQYEGKPCYELTKTMPNGTEFLAILDKESLYLLKTEEFFKQGETGDKFTVLYSDHRRVSGVVEPYRTKLYRNGELDNEVVIDSIRANPGVMSLLFEIPDEIRK